MLFPLVQAASFFSSLTTTPAKSNSKPIVAKEPPVTQSSWSYLSSLPIPIQRPKNYSVLKDGSPGEDDDDDDEEEIGVSKNFIESRRDEEIRRYGGCMDHYHVRDVSESSSLSEGAVHDADIYKDFPEKHWQRNLHPPTPNYHYHPIPISNHRVGKPVAKKKNRSSNKRAASLLRRSNPACPFSLVKQSVGNLNLSSHEMEDDDNDDAGGNECDAELNVNPLRTSAKSYGGQLQLASTPPIPYSPESPLPLCPSLLDDNKRSMLTLPQGIVMGEQRLEQGIRIFWSLPYAAPAERWRAPKRVSYIGSNRLWNATRPGPHCIQAKSVEQEELRDKLIREEGGDGASEDCLFLNVYTPTVDRIGDTQLPVLFFVHGGMFSMGGNKGLLWRADDLVQSERIIVIVPNYRLGVFGFMAGEPLAAEDSIAVGNYGTMDLIEALRWTAANVSYFGGDPNNITIAGHSAGSIMVSNLLCILNNYSDLAKHIQRAIMFSGALGTSTKRRTMYDTSDDDSMQRVIPAQSRYEQFAAMAGCTGEDSLNCLRQLPADTLNHLSGQWFNQWSPLQETPLIPQDPLHLMAAGKCLHIPCLLTSSRDDGSLFTAKHNLQSEDEYLVTLQHYFGDEAGDIAEHYERLLGQRSFRHLASRIVGDAFFRCPVQEQAMILNQHTTVRLYEFRQEPQIPWLNPAHPPFGVFHGAELLFFFHGVRDRFGRDTGGRVQRNLVAWMTGSSLLPIEGSSQSMAPYLDKECLLWRKIQRGKPPGGSRTE